jgi:hypothetical protein
VQDGPESILLYPIEGNLSNCKRGLSVFLLYPTRRNLWQSKAYDLGLTFVKACSDLLASHHGSVTVLGQHGNMEVLYSPKGDEITTRGYRALPLQSV